MSRLPNEAEVLVVGGGPAGLAAAIAARRRGFEVVLADRAQAPIDKACGEGVMPDGVAALRELGIPVGGDSGFPFHGIRLVEGELVAEACFPGTAGLGIRRPVLHRLLMEHAEAAGVRICWGTPVSALDAGGVQAGGQSVRCRWVIGADGRHSRVRPWAGMYPAWSSVPRIGLRQHFRIRPWTDFVEVHWRRESQVYVTPVGPHEICIALLGNEAGLRMADLADRFPTLGRRLAHAQPTSAVRGATTGSTQLGRVADDRLALIGDASGSVDAITGEGLALAFRQATILAEALSRDDLSLYQAAHLRLGRIPRLIARLMLAMGGKDGMRHRALRTLASRPQTFSRLLAVHVGALRPAAVSLDVVGFAWRFLAASGGISAARNVP
ncbi:MAG TPA: FAD-dependent monooxygenase [Candidatus Binataceae bacterium]|nr:FAD-dependent monooxygenase [Candidatus Binataceae bacterium]